MTHSIKNLNELPNITVLKKQLQGLALVDAAIMHDWEYRYFSYNCNWDGEHKEMMASMRDGHGSELFILFTSYGVVGKVLCDHPVDNTHDAVTSIPDCFSNFTNEPAFRIDNASYFFWHEVDSNSWQSSPDQRNDYPLLKFLSEGISHYHSFAEAYYERSIDIGVLKEVFLTRVISEEQLAILNPDVTLDDLRSDLEEILAN